MLAGLGRVCIQLSAQNAMPTRAKALKPATVFVDGRVGGYYQFLCDYTPNNLSMEDGDDIAAMSGQDRITVQLKGYETIAGSVKRTLPC